jgi:CRP-like cAMP-binding protein
MKSRHQMRTSRRKKPALPDADSLLSSRLFDGIGARERAMLASAVTSQNYARKEAIFQQGNLPRGIYAVRSGMVKLSCRNEEGREVVIDVVCDGGTFGEPALLLSDRYTVSAEVIEDAQIVFLTKESFFAALEASRSRAQNLLCELARQV